MKFVACCRWYFGEFIVGGCEVFYLIFICWCWFSFPFSTLKMVASHLKEDVENDGGDLLIGVGCGDGVGERTTCIHSLEEGFYLLFDGEGLAKGRVIVGKGSIGNVSVCYV